MMLLQHKRDVEKMWDDKQVRIRQEIEQEREYEKQRLL